MKNLYILIGCLFSVLVANSQGVPCNSNPLVGLKPLLPGETDKVLSYQIRHEFNLAPDNPVNFKVQTISFNHAWTKEGNTGCKSYAVKPAQKAFFLKYGKDTIIDDTAINNFLPVDTSVFTVTETKIPRTESAYAQSCYSRAKANTCIMIDSISGEQVSGVIQSYGYAQAIRPPQNSDGYAFSWSGVTCEDDQNASAGEIGWDPYFVSVAKGKSRSIRQKAGTNDPIVFGLKDITNPGNSFDGTLLSIKMEFQTEDDTLQYINYWKDDSVHVESDSCWFVVEFPSPYTSKQGFIHLLVQNGVVVMAQKTGVFNPVPLPTPGTPVPFTFPLISHLSFHYNLDTMGILGNDSLSIKFFMYGNPINNHVQNIDTISFPSINSPSCPGGANGSITAAVNFMTPPYLFLWNNGASTQTISGLTAGIYTITITDIFANTASATVVLTQPLPIALTSVVTHVKCFGTASGSITNNVSGGTPPYQYLWNNGSIQKNRSGLIAGLYLLTITDANGCFTMSTFLISQSPTMLSIAISKVKVRCGGASTGTVTANPSGGMAPYSFVWNTGATSQSITSVPAGVYTVTVTDVAGCVKTISTTLTQNSPLLVSVIPYADSATAIVAGGVSPYTYQWNTIPVQTNATATGLLACATYQVKVKDAKNCTKIEFITLACLQQNEQKGLKGASEIVVYPNPVDDFLTIDFSEFITDETFQLSLVNLLGEKIIETNFNISAQSDIYLLNVSKIPNGIYYLNVSFSIQSVNIKVVIQ